MLAIIIIDASLRLCWHKTLEFIQSVNNWTQVYATQPVQQWDSQRNITKQVVSHFVAIIVDIYLCEPSNSEKYAKLLPLKKYWHKLMTCFTECSFLTYKHEACFCSQSMNKYMEQPLLISWYIFFPGVCVCVCVCVCTCVYMIYMREPQYLK